MSKSIGYRKRRINLGFTLQGLIDHGKQMNPPCNIGRNALIALEKERGGIGERIEGALNAILEDIERKRAWERHYD